MAVNPARVEVPFGNGTLVLETGKFAKQAHGSVMVRFGDTAVLCAAVAGNTIPGRDFFPLQVEYRERTYAAGKFPGGFIKRETRPSTKETLTSRMIDRPTRPLFPTDYFNEVQIHATVFSADRENDPDVLAMIGTSAALHVSDIPFLKPYGAVRLGRLNGELVVMPTSTEMEESDLDLIVAGTADAVCMIEGFAREIPEPEMGDAISEAHRQCQVVIEAIDRLRAEAGLPPKVLPPAVPANPLADEIYKKFGAEFKERYLTKGKKARNTSLDEFKEKLTKEYLPEGVAEPKYTASQVSAAIAAIRERIFREITLGGTRIDGRAPKELRNISCDVSVLPRTHGSALFQRGETQGLVTATLGTISDEQKVDGLADEYSKKFFLDYNFPPYSVGECKPIRGPGRREIGHGMLAERSLKAVIPPATRFPYTVRLVSEILESNGSSSMASVCGGTLALMDAGVPIKRPVAGISVGLVMDGENFTLLTDIQGDEDHYGDMDFKVAGTQKGVTGIQLDIKLDGVSETVVRGALEQAKEGRLQILKSMLGTLPAPRKEISSFAPRMVTVKIAPDAIGKLIGPGGKNIRACRKRQAPRSRSRTTAPSRSPVSTRSASRRRGRGSRRCAPRSRSARSTRGRSSRSRSSAPSSRSHRVATACATSPSSTPATSAASMTSCRLATRSRSRSSPSTTRAASSCRARRSCRRARVVKRAASVRHARTGAIGTATAIGATGATVTAIVVIEGTAATVGATRGGGRGGGRERGGYRGGGRGRD